MRIAIAILFLSSLAMAQSTPPKPITDAEKLDLRAAQVPFLQARNALQASPVWAAYQQAQAELDSKAAKIFSDRKLDPKEWTLCDGAGAPGCDGVVKGDIQLRPIPKAAVPAKPESK